MGTDLAAEAASGVTPARETPLTGRTRSGVRRLVYLTDVTVHLARREFASRHRGSILGWLWALAPPLLQLLVSYFLFTKVIPLKVPNYPIFLLTGILAWSWFARSLAFGAASLEQSRELVLRPGFPVVVLPLRGAIVALLDYLLAVPIVVVALLATGDLHATIAFLPVLVAIQLVFSAALGWILAPLQVFFRDVQHLVTVLTTIGYWITPVFYARRAVPSRFQLIYQLNPMSHLIEWQRDVVLDGRLPSGTGVLVLAALTGLAAAVSLGIFAVLKDSLPENL